MSAVSGWMLNASSVFMSAITTMYRMIRKIRFRASFLVPSIRRQMPWKNLEIVERSEVMKDSGN